MPFLFKYGSRGLFCSLLKQALRDVKKYIVLPVYFFLLIIWIFLSSHIWDKTPLCQSDLDMIHFHLQEGPEAWFCKFAIYETNLEGSLQ